MKTSAAPVGIPERASHRWRVRSTSGPGWHYVRLGAQTQMSCTCSGWRFGHGAPCKHIRAVQRRLAEEAAMDEAIRRTGVKIDDR
jgi:hypothetical protein